MKEFLKGISHIGKFALDSRVCMLETCKHESFVKELLSLMLHNEGLQVHPICSSFIWELLNLVPHNEGHTKFHNNCRS